MPESKPICKLMIYMNYPARIPEGRQNEQSADLLTVSVFRDLPEEFDEAATARGAENLFRRNRHRACKRQFSNLISFRIKWLRRPWPRRWLINPGKGGTANSFMSWRKWLYAVEPGTYCPTFSNKNWMGFAKSLTVASGEIPFSSQERSFLLQNLQWRSHNPFRNRTHRIQHPSFRHGPSC